jgi:NAD+ kinase
VTYHALNDVVIGRASQPAGVRRLAIDGSRLAVHRCDAVIVASATGSSAYSLSAGGPILHPESRDVLLTVVAPHLAAARLLVLPPETVVDLNVSADMDAVEHRRAGRPALSSGETVSVCRSPHVARSCVSRSRRTTGKLAERLDWLRV